jgi:hypothetical protein
MNRPTLATAIAPAGVFLLTFLAARPAAAQQFFGAGASIFDPEIGVVQSGVKNDVQATVSADRKYVTLTMRASQAQLLSLNEFTVQVGNGGAAGGFVGGAGGGGGNGGAAAGGGGGGAGGGAGGRAQASPRAAPRTAIAVRPGVLDKPGMTLLGRADDRTTAPRSS